MGTSIFKKSSLILFCGLVMLGVAVLLGGWLPNSAPLFAKEPTMNAQKNPLASRIVHPDGSTEYALFAAG